MLASSKSNVKGEYSSGWRGVVDYSSDSRNYLQAVTPAPPLLFSCFGKKSGFTRVRRQTPPRSPEAHHPRLLVLVIISWLQIVHTYVWTETSGRYGPNDVHITIAVFLDADSEARHIAVFFFRSFCFSFFCHFLFS